MIKKKTEKRPVFPEESELRTETMAGSFPSDSLGWGLASIGSPGYGGIHGDQGD